MRMKNQKKEIRDWEVLTHPKCKVFIPINIDFGQGGFPGGQGGFPGGFPGGAGGFPGGFGGQGGLGDYEGNDEEEEEEI